MRRNVAQLGHGPDTNRQSVESILVTGLVRPVSSVGSLSGGELVVFQLNNEATPRERLSGQVVLGIEQSFPIPVGT